MYNRKPKTESAMIESAFKLYSEHDIESITNDEIAKDTGHGVATLYRYFGEKADLVVETAAVKWDEVLSGFSVDESGTAEDMLIRFLDSFIDLYRNHKDLLRFTAFFSTYVVAHNVENTIAYDKVMERYKDWFRKIYEKDDGTVSTSEPLDEMYFTIYNLMLRMSMRYALIGEGDLEKVKTAVLMMYVE